MSDEFDRNQEQYERKLARQKQLDMMEAAAAGQSYGQGFVSTHISSGSSVHSGSQASSSSAPEGAIESARRFLWDEEDAAAAAATAGGSKLTSANTYDMYDQQEGLVKNGGTQAQGFGSRMANTIMGSLFSSRNLNADDDDIFANKNVNLAPRRISAFTSDAQPSHDAEEYINPRHRHYRHNNQKDAAAGAGPLSCIGDCCMAIFHTIVGACAVLCEYMTACLAQMSPRLCCMIMGALTGLALLIFGIIAIIARAKNGAAAAAAAGSIDQETLPPIKDTVRYDSIRQAILNSKFTMAPTLDTAGTAQNYALRWMTDDDPAQITNIDEGLLQRYALATFYFSTYVYSEIMDSQGLGGTDAGAWTYMDYWMSEQGVCNWFGVSCPPIPGDGGLTEVHYNENADVTHLNLTMNNVRGFLPSELAALTSLQSLDLGDNKLISTIPKAIATLPELKELYLENNLLTGTIHSEFGHLTKLRDFFIGTNYLNGTIPVQLQGLTQLRALGLDENFLTGTIPNIWACTNLLILYLDSNKLTGTISPNIQGMSELIDVRLRKNALTGSIPAEIAALTHLELLYLDDNNLVGSIPPSWDKMTRMQEIQLYKNQLTGVLPDSISTLRDLKVLYVDNNKLVGSIPASFGNLMDLHTMYVFNNAMTGILPTTLGSMDNMKDLQIYNNKFTGPLPSELGKLYKLEKLEAQDNHLSGAIPSELGGIENLQMLKLYRNKLTGTMPVEVCNAMDNFQLGFLATDCNTKNGGKVTCECCSACYP